MIELRHHLDFALEQVPVSGMTKQLRARQSDDDVRPRRTVEGSVDHPLRALSYPPLEACTALRRGPESDSGRTVSRPSANVRTVDPNQTDIPNASGSATPAFRRRLFRNVPLALDRSRTAKADARVLNRHMGARHLRIAPDRSRPSRPILEAVGHDRNPAVEELRVGAFDDDQHGRWQGPSDGRRPHDDALVRIDQPCRRGLDGWRGRLAEDGATARSAAAPASPTLAAGTPFPTGADTLRLSSPCLTRSSTAATLASPRSSSAASSASTSAPSSSSSASLLRRVQMSGDARGPAFGEARGSASRRPVGAADGASHRSGRLERCITRVRSAPSVFRS